LLLLLLNADDNQRTVAWLQMSEGGFCGPAGFGPWIDGDLSLCFMEMVLFGIANIFGIVFCSWRFIALLLLPKRRVVAGLYLWRALVTFSMIATLARVVLLAVHLGVHYDPPFQVVSDFLTILSWSLASAALLITYARGERVGFQLLTFFSLYGVLTIWRTKTSISLLVKYPACVPCATNLSVAAFYWVVLGLAIAYELKTRTTYVPIPKEPAFLDSESDEDTSLEEVHSASATLKDFFFDVLFVSPALLVGTHFCLLILFSTCFLVLTDILFKWLLLRRVCLLVWKWFRCL
jgi:hypothetical protein